MTHNGISIPAVLQEGRDSSVGIFEQVLVDRPFPLDANELCKVGLGSDGAVELHRDAAALVDLEDEMDGRTAIHHLDVVTHGGLVVLVLAQFGFVLAKPTLDLSAVVGLTGRQPEPGQNQRVHRRRDSTDAQPLDPGTPSGAGDNPQLAVARLHHLDVGRQKTVRVVEPTQCVDDQGRVLDAKRRPVGILDGATEDSGRDSEVTLELDALDHLKRHEGVLQGDAVAGERAPYLDAFVAPQAEQMGHALADLPHRQRLPEPRFHELVGRGVLQSPTVTEKHHLDDRLADEVAHLRGRRRRRRGGHDDRQEQEQRH